VSLLECNEIFGAAWADSPIPTSSDGPGDLLSADIELLKLLLFRRLNGRGVDDLESVPMLFDGEDDCP
jgi:hypothetical protein